MHDPSLVSAATHLPHGPAAQPAAPPSGTARSTTGGGLGWASHPGGKRCCNQLRRLHWGWGSGPLLLPLLLLSRQGRQGRGAELASLP